MQAENAGLRDAAKDKSIEAREAQEALSGVEAILPSLKPEAAKAVAEAIGIHPRIVPEPPVPPPLPAPEPSIVKPSKVHDSSINFSVATGRDWLSYCVFWVLFFLSLYALCSYADSLDTVECHHSPIRAYSKRTYCLIPGSSPHMFPLPPVKRYLPMMSALAGFEDFLHNKTTSSWYVADDAAVWWPGSEAQLCFEFTFLEVLADWHEAAYNAVAQWFHSWRLFALFVGEPVLYGCVSTDVVPWYACFVMALWLLATRSDFRADSWFDLQWIITPFFPAHIVYRRVYTVSLLDSEEEDLRADSISLEKWKHTDKLQRVCVESNCWLPRFLRHREFMTVSSELASQIQVARNLDPQASRADTLLRLQQAASRVNTVKLNRYLSNKGQNIVQNTVQMSLLAFDGMLDQFSRQGFQFRQLWLSVVIIATVIGMARLNFLSLALLSLAQVSLSILFRWVTLGLLP